MPSGTRASCVVLKWDRGRFRIQLVRDADGSLGSVRPGPDLRSAHPGLLGEAQEGSGDPGHRLGPGAITTVLLYTGGAGLTQIAVLTAVLVVVLLFTLASLLLAPRIMRLFGET